MLNTDDDVRAALRRALDGPEPPIAYRLDDALRAGRRRRRQRRLGATVGAFAVVAGASAAALALHHGADPSLQTAAGPTVQTSPAPAPRSVQTTSPAPAPRSVQTTPAAAGTAWSPVPVPPASPGAIPDGLTIDGIHSCQDGQAFPQAHRGGALPAEPASASAMRDAVRQLLPNTTVTATRTGQDPNRVAAVGPLTESTAALDAAAGHSDVDLVVTNYDGTPTQAADLAALHPCATAPQRMTLADGTVLQLFGQANPGDRANLRRTMQVFTPGGHLFVFSESTLPMSSSIRPGQPGHGLPNLPLSAGQLAGVGSRLATLG